MGQKTIKEHKDAVRENLLKGVTMRRIVSGFKAFRAAKRKEENEQLAKAIHEYEAARLALSLDPDNEDAKRAVRIADSLITNIIVVETGLQGYAAMRQPPPDLDDRQAPAAENETVPS